ncbi:MAG: VWA domain-containing protein [Acidobacteriota bacterium]
MSTRSTAYLGLAVVVATVSLPGTAAPATPPTPPLSRPPQRSISQRPSFGAEVEMVTLNVSVFDADDAPVGDLKKEDFALLEDGVEQQIIVLLAPSETPLEIAMVLDFSGSIADNAPYAKRVALAFLEELSADDCVYLLPFNHQVGPGIWGKADDPDLRALIEATEVAGGTSLFDAMLEGFSRLERNGESPETVEDYGAFGLHEGGEAIEEADESAYEERRQARERMRRRLKFQPVDECGVRILGAAAEASSTSRRQAMVVLTDGDDQDSISSFADALLATHEAEVPVFSIAAGAAAHPVGGYLSAKDIWSQRLGRRGHAGRASPEAMERMRELEAQWQEVSRISGGKLIKGEGSSRRLRRAFDEALSLMRASYLIGYYPSSTDSDDGELAWHQVEVKLRDPKLHALTRSGYFRTIVDTKTAKSATKKGIELLTQRRPSDALLEFDRAIRADPADWKAHYHRGIALGLQGKWQDARAASFQAARLSPGVGAVQELAWLTAYSLGDYEAAWEHAIRTHQAGTEMTEELDMLRQQAPQPADLEARLDAPRIIVGGSEIPDLLAQAALKKVFQKLEGAISDAPMLGLVTEPWRADYLLIINDERLGKKKPRSLKGRLELYDTLGKRLYKQELALSDIDDPAAMSAEVAGDIGHLEQWLTRGVSSGPD